MPTPERVATNFWPMPIFLDRKCAAIQTTVKARRAVPTPVSKLKYHSDDERKHPPDSAFPTLTEIVFLHETARFTRF